MADLLGDIVTLTTHPEPHASDWLSVSLNLIGLMPEPDTAAARMVLRPTLFLARQELLQRGNARVGEAALRTLAVNLNHSIQGELDNLAQRIQSRLPLCWTRRPPSAKACSLTLRTAWRPWHGRSPLRRPP
ncbi:hypothetical protein GPU89_21100 [Burkholderia cepacia]|nr:hypothetical protein [Burkholderia cepacia]